MPVAVLSKTVIFDAPLYVPGGMVNRWVSGVAAEFKRYAVAEAPIREGTLKRGIRASRGRQVGRRRVEANIASTAPHSLFVIEGTAYQGRRYIYSRLGWANKEAVDRVARSVRAGDKAGVHPGWYMTLPPPGKRFHLRVHGQRRNNFMFRAWDLTAARHSSLRGRHSPF